MRASNQWLAVGLPPIQNKACDALLAEWLPNSQRSKISGMGHFLQMVDPHPVAETLATFFARHPMS
jgi:pimeloyl-ACP methyl ester carboxylesterase